MTALTSSIKALAACRGVTVRLGSGDAEVRALADVDLTIHPRESLALWGPSGSGKTTLLHVLGGLVPPSTGTVSWKGELTSSVDPATRARARGLAYVFQAPNLLPHFTAFENVAFAMHVSAPPPDALGPREMLGLVGLADKLDALPGELSGGEQQRVAIARALSQQPELLLCDEPTGHLDSDTGERVLNLIDALHEELGFALVTATHDAGVAARYDRTIELADGRPVAVESYKW
jgi:ABC-type lipoprotein export system ATPase subunit